MPSIDERTLREFEEGLNTLFPEKSTIGAKIIGGGEISTVFIIDHPAFYNYAFKRLPIFSYEHEVDEYEKALFEYIQLLREIGIGVIETEGIRIKTSDGRIIYYIAQPLLKDFIFCNKVLRRINLEEALYLFRTILLKLKSIYDFNRHSDNVKIGIDAQMSNWIIKNLQSQEQKLPEKPELAYVDIATPLFRKEGKEMLRAELFLKSAPPILRSILKALFLKDILDRYYNFRLTIVDLIANLFREKLLHLIEPFIEEANKFFSEECSELQKINLKEIRSYYKKDAFIWGLFLSLRKFHRAITTKILSQRYEFILPGKIER